MKRETCCFSGHRNIPPKQKPDIARRLEEKISALISEGVTDFCAGGALGFDTMAAAAVLRLRSKNPGVRLRLILPCRNQAASWSNPADVSEYNRILAAADEVIYASEEYTRWCMFARNRMLVDQSSRCVCFLSDETGGTAYTVGYARKKGLEIINLAG